MKTVLCYGDSNTWGCPPVRSFDEVRRYGPQERWPGVLRMELGEGYAVIEEGLNGRTTVWDDPVEGIHKNGKTYLIPCLESHAPLDLVVLMLGTNDLKMRFSVPAFDIALGVQSLIDVILKSSSGPDGKAPKVLLMCPTPVTRLSLLADIFEGSEEKSRKLAPHFQEIARQMGCAYLNTGDLIVSSDIDGIHFAPGEHLKLGKAVAARVRDLLK